METNAPSRAIIDQAEYERLKSDASLYAFLSPLFARFEKLVTDIAESRYEGAPPALVREAQSMLVMTPERCERWRVAEWTVRR